MNALSMSPQNIQDDTWYYEESYGLDIIHELPERPGKPLHIKIPWRKLEASVRRHQIDKIAAKRRKGK